MEQYYGCIDFYRAFVEDRKSLITNDDIDHLIDRLRRDGYKVREFSDERFTVRSPEEVKASEANRKAKQALGASRFTKLGAAFPKELVSQFSDACRKLRCSQSAILMPVIINTIEQADLLKTRSL